MHLNSYRDLFRLRRSSRRAFLCQMSAFALAPRIMAQPPELDARIKRIRLSTLQGRFHRFVAMNAYDTKPKGETYEHTLIRIETDSGVEGLAPGGYADLCTASYARMLKPLIGEKIGDLYQMEDGHVTKRSAKFGPLLAANRHLDCGFFDIIGKLLKKPVWMLIGDEGRKQVPVYDSTIYFSDVWLHDRGIATIHDDCKEAIHSGYAGVKIKLGRGDKWMNRDEGDRRDIDVTLAAREAIGPGAVLMADPNYGYRGQYDKALHLMDSVRQAKLLWMEEIFPETPQLYAKFKQDLAARHNPCKLAFGEHLHEPWVIDPYLHPSLVDFVQYDIRANGFLDNVAVAKKCAQAGAIVDNHNWASQMGFVMSLHLARALGNYGILESDRSTCNVLQVGVKAPVDGKVLAPTGPGLGIAVNEEVYKRDHLAHEIVVE